MNDEFDVNSNAMQADEDVVTSTVEYQNDDDAEMNHNVDGNDSDIIELKIYGGTVTYWKFPENLEKCPVHLCGQTFESKSDGIIHYRTNHANGSYFCSLCDKPIRCVTQCVLSGHYRRMHPHRKVPKIRSNTANTANKEATKRSASHVSAPQTNQTGMNQLNLCSFYI